ncbi:hypothetical protein CFBP4996_27450 (plasmid) [Agrobacterium leguminum]|uniref:Uncharacterized protein n=1 Tax=Agrobacterium deltaense NCPPB 1641 TaxID=1183425 RepID=A0A1S7U9X0_9HYPH|nr:MULTISPECIES: hypothetical protein [Agrobacterium]WFS69998.1 hypothetical protein CFBP4996_27450 [Agrobacterium leguminum]CVI63188.1 hypothetical protein AGR7A_pAt20131 [Agrobacterium deltaense NCPPB 1641]
MVLVAEELKNKRAEIGLKVEEMRAQIVALERQQVAFDVVIQTYELDYSPVSESRILDRRRKRVATDPVSELLKDFDQINPETV